MRDKPIAISGRAAILPFLLVFGAGTASAQCTFTVGPQGPFVDSAAQNVTVQITASAANCPWASSAERWLRQRPERRQWHR
jgi:hypothetical protein